MHENNYAAFLSKSSVSSPVSFKKSPHKYEMYEPLKQDPGYLEKSMPSTSWKERNLPSEYQNIKKVPDQFSNLRQTFDSRTNARLQEKLTKYAINREDNSKPQQKMDTALRQTFHTRLPSSPNHHSLSQSAALQRVYKKDDFRKFQNSEHHGRSSNSDRNQDNNKFKKYMDVVEKFKDELETTNKMSEEIKKLKQNRKKRLEAREKEQIQGEQNQTWRKKNYYEYYTPKYEKSSLHDRFQVSKPIMTSFNNTAEKYSSAQRVEKQYPSPNSAKLPKRNTRGREKEEESKSRISRKYSEIKLGGCKLSDFIVGKNLGQGKFGTVFQAKHKLSGGIFALKKVPKQMIKSHLMIDQFILQLKLQTYLNHQNILTLYTHFDDKDSIYLVLEYMQDGTLFSHLKKNKVLPQNQVAIKMRQIASAVKYLHENTIAHRDIKPQNVVMTHGVCKLCDFGWATVCDDRRKTYCGTFDYAPPEILEGMEYDFTVDLWCLGVLTYELLVGKAPFYHISRKQTMKRILNVENSHIEYPETLSRNAVSFIDNLIKKNPKQRMSSDMILEHPFLKYAEEKK